MLKRDSRWSSNSCWDVDSAAGERYSRKVFIGGLPIDITESEVHEHFARASGCSKLFVDWPRRPTNPSLHFRPAKNLSGYVFLVFDDGDAVERLLMQCYTEDKRHYMLVSSKTMHDKPVQVRPWLLSDTHYVPKPDLPLDPRRTVFIGGLPRPTRACDLAKVVQYYFGAVSYVGIDIDPELKYPKGAARVTFCATKSYVAALQSSYLRVPHGDIEKQVDIKPYVLDDQPCNNCLGNQCDGRVAPYFCGEPSCLQYLCEACWDEIHLGELMLKRRGEHRPFVRIGEQTKQLLRLPHQLSYGHSRQAPLTPMDHNMAKTRTMAGYEEAIGYNGYPQSRWKGIYC